MGAHPRAMLAAGLALVAGGATALAWPDPTLLVAGLAFGAPLVAVGAIRLALDDVIGIVTLAAGILLLVRPGESVATTALVLGIWWALSGAARLLRPPRGWPARIGGLLGVGVGAAILAIPEIELGLLVVLTGAGFVLLGVALATGGVVARRRATAA